MCARVFVCVCWVVFKPREARTLKMGVGRMNETFSVLRGTEPRRLQRLITVWIPETCLPVQS